MSMSDELFLGRLLDGDEDVRLPADRLRTHGVVVGMTGSGKTGLCVVLLEELARAGVPVIAIDPKGDLGNLGLLFGSLSPDEFAPWVGADEQADEVAARWRDGLARWGLGAQQVHDLRERLALTIYTPGSDAGVPIDVLGAFRRPDRELDEEARLAIVTSSVSGLLQLVGHGGDPVRDPAHIVLSQIVDSAWSAGEDPDLETLILRLVDPPFEKVGVFPVDRFFPPDDRMDLAMALNGLVAAPTFAPWTRGVGLDIDAMLRPVAGGRVPIHVFSLAHLADPQRQFVLSLLLGRLQAWSRSQPGTSDLRALLYFDEVAGYVPPHPHDPPTKRPLLTMMKQARAVGLGVVLATQNPVDIDYKALSNAGLWCIGRLQTPQDRSRLLKGLGRPDLNDVVQNLDKRCFLLHDTRAADPVVLRSRHAMSYLRGPMTAVEIERLSSGSGQPAALAAAVARAAPATQAAPAVPATQAAPPTEPGLLSAPPPTPGDSWFLDPRTVFSARLAETFTPHAEPCAADGKLLYRPALFAELQMTFDEDKAGFYLDHAERRLWFPLGEVGPGDADVAPLQDDDLQGSPEPGARFAPLPDWADEAAELKALSKRAVEQVYRSETRGMFVHRKLKLYGKAGEERDAFEMRCRKAIAGRVHEKVAKLKDRYEKQADRLDDKIRKAESKISELEGSLQARRAEEAINIGETVFSLFSGRRRSITSAVSKRRQTMRTRERLDQTGDQIEQYQEQAAELLQELQQDVADATADGEALLGDIEEREVRLERNDIRLARFGVLWVPVTRRI